MLVGCIVVYGCAAPSDSDRAKTDPVEAEIANAALGIAVTGCASTGYSVSGTVATLTLTLPAGTVVLNAPSGNITANGRRCVGTVGGVANSQLTTANVSKLVLNGTTAANTIILDLLPGTFGTRIMSSVGGITVNFSSGVANADAFMIRATPGVDNYKFAKVAADGNIYIEMTGDKNADVRIIPPTMAGTLSLTASLGAGADIITATPVTGAMADITGFPSSTATPTALVTTGMTMGITAYGGAGADTFTGGMGNDAFYGGDDNDTFKMLAVSDGSDIYSGDQGIDTVLYNTRVLSSDNQTIDIGPAVPSVEGTVDLSTLDYSDMASGGAIDTRDLVFQLGADGVDHTVTFSSTTDTDPSAVVDAINAVVAGTASLNGQNQLVLANSAGVGTGAIEIKTSSAATALGIALGLVTTIDDADDGLSGEHDDVRYTTENITSGAGNDIIVGDSNKNVILGGAGNDIIVGGANTTCTALADGDTLSGEANNDTIYMPAKNCWAAINGGTGADTVNYSGRGAALALSNDGLAVDGDASGTSERANIATDIETIIGGFGPDAITGGMANDTLVGGAGNDIIRGGAGDDHITGGAGDDTLSGEAGDDTLIGGTGSDTMNGGTGTGDTVDYSSYLISEPLLVTLCTATGATYGEPTVGTESGGSTSTTCPLADDGFAEADQLLNVEHVIGGAGADDLSASTFGSVGVRFEGGAGNDNLTGGPNADYLYGDDGDDTIDGSGGDDWLEGGLGDDQLIGGSGDDQCSQDAADVTHAPLTCETLL